MTVIEEKMIKEYNIFIMKANMLTLRNLVLSLS